MEDETIWVRSMEAVRITLVDQVNFVQCDEHHLLYDEHHLSLQQGEGEGT